MALVYITVHTCVVDISIDHVLTVVSIVLVPFKVISRLHKQYRIFYPRAMRIWYIAILFGFLPFHKFWRGWVGKKILVLLTGG